MIVTQTQLDSLGGRPRIALGCAALLLAATFAHSAHAAVFSAREGDAPIEFTLPAYETTMVAILVSAICGLVREYGGFEALLYFIKSVFKGNKGGQLGMGLLVGAMDIATANNTVAIVMANPIAREMSEDYGISPRKAASILDTFSCVFQGVIPYGAQMLVAISAAQELGFAVSAFEILPNLLYPYLLLVSSLIFIFVIPGRKKK